MPSDSILIVGGGPAGLEAARGIAEIGYKAILVEKRDRLGGTPDEASYAALTPHFKNTDDVLGAMIGAITSNPLVEIRTGSTVKECSGAAGDFAVTLSKDGKEEVVSTGAIILATGFDHFDPGRETQMYGYYEHDDVITLVDAEKMLKQHRFVRPSNGAVPKRICFIQCVGSRDRQIGNEYCSKVCCGIASKQAIEIRQIVPDANVFIFYIDMRMYGYWENQLYWPAQEQYKVNYVKGIVTEVLKKGDKLVVRGEDTTMGRPMEIPMDLVILSVGMEPSTGTKALAKLLGVRQNKYGFIEAIGEPMDTVSTSVEGVFVAGAAAGPKDLEDSTSMAGAAAMKAIATVRRKSAITAKV
ncbi:MAG TPA: pyridine nucleotide-disulfide oxidoreductase [Bacteroidetes bacterium]|nr:pyridine nucleotide-disulfide oxidoreductase [Bacteroidota bacterium]